MSDANLITVFISCTLGFVLLLAGLVLMFINQKKRSYKYEMEKKERDYQYRNELLNSRLEVQEHLLNEMSREIHDNVGQVLSLVKVHLFTISNQSGDQKTRSLLETSYELLDKAIEDLRNISHTQNAGLMVRLGLQETIRKELKFISDLKKYNCNLEISGDPYSLSPEQELLVYRIAQEAIHNSIKHSGGGQLKVVLRYVPELLTLMVKDNGKGFDVSGERTATGIGIQHMRHRTKILNGAFEIKSILAQGTTVTIKIPRDL